MAKITITLLVVSTILLLVTFTKGINILQGGKDVMSHLYWAVATLCGALAANLIAMLHAAQSEKLIRDLRAELERKAQSGTPQ